MAAMSAAAAATAAIELLFNISMRITVTFDSRMLYATKATAPKLIVDLLAATLLIYFVLYTPIAINKSWAVSLCDECFSVLSTSYPHADSSYIKQKFSV